jgi:hypothetical protein
MKGMKLTALFSILFAASFILSSCDKDDAVNDTVEFRKTGIALTGGQENPANASTAVGSMDVTYRRDTRTLTYTVSWSGLTDSLVAMHIHGLAPVGFNAGIVQNIIAGVGASTGTNGAQFSTQFVAGGPFRFSKAGNISGSLLIDGNLIKEQDLLNGMYYMNLHSKVIPGGEIRAQITF